MFATHYHELTALDQVYPSVKNYNIAVKKRGDDITFLRKIVPGGADDSYGIEVAKLAGIPNAVINRAKDVLRELEMGEGTKPVVPVRSGQEEVSQISFGPSNQSKIIEKVRNINLDTLTPIEALNILFELKKLLEN
jgi:DNA mismatch repair protein MutS